MKNIGKLIFIYCYICDCYDSYFSPICQRLSNNSDPHLTDQEVITIFLYGLLVEKRTQITDIYDFADNYLRSWFPDLGTYQQFNYRLNKLHGVFPVLIELLIQYKMQKTHPENFVLYQDLIVSVVDSMPVILAQGARSYSAKVAPQYCNQTYSSSKKMYYYGVKLHVMGFKRFGKLPIPEYVGTTPASNHDLEVFKPQWEKLQNRAIFGDKAYANKDWEIWLAQNNNVHIYSPVKKKKGQEHLSFFQELYSTAVSQVRQPIESFFNWIIEKVGLQKASKVRSPEGLLVHVYGRFAAAMMAMAFDVF